MLPLYNHKQGMLFHTHGEVGPQVLYLALDELTVGHAGGKFIETRDRMGDDLVLLRLWLTGR